MITQVRMATPQATMFGVRTKARDERFKPLRDHIAETWERARGFKIITDASDWVRVSRMLGTVPTLTLGQLTGSWDGFLRAYMVDSWYQRQKPVRYWAGNITPWVVALPRPTLVQSMVARIRADREATARRLRLLKDRSKREERWLRAYESRVNRNI